MMSILFSLAIVLRGCAIDSARQNLSKQLLANSIVKRGIRVVLGDVFGVGYEVDEGEDKGGAYYFEQEENRIKDKG